MDGTTPTAYPASGGGNPPRPQEARARPSDPSFYRARGAMKRAVILDGVHRRHRGGQTVSAGYAVIDKSVPVLAARGR